MEWNDLTLVKFGMNVLACVKIGVVEVVKIGMSVGQKVVRVGIKIEMMLELRAADEGYLVSSILLTGTNWPSSCEFLISEMCTSGSSFTTL